MDCPPNLPVRLTAKEWQTPASYLVRCGLSAKMVFITVPGIPTLSLSFFARPNHTSPRLPSQRKAQHRRHPERKGWQRMVPAYNEETRIAAALEEMVEHLDQQFGRPTNNQLLQPERQERPAQKQHKRANARRNRTASSSSPTPQPRPPTPASARPAPTPPPRVTRSSSSTTAAATAPSKLPSPSPAATPCTTSCAS